MVFEKEVVNASHFEPIVVQFSGETCPPCKMIKPMLTDLMITRRDFKYIVIDAWKELELAKQYKVRSVPHILLFRDGKVVSKYPGFLSKSKLEEWLDAEIYTVS